MRIVSKWLRKLFSKKIETSKEQYLFKGILENFKPSEGNVILVDTVNVIIKYKEKVVGAGISLLSQIRTDDDGNVFSEVSDLMIDQNFTVETNNLFEVTYSTIGHNIDTGALTHEVYMTFKDAKLVESKIVCDKNNITSSSIKREASA